MKMLFRLKRKAKWILAMVIIGMLSGKVEAAELNTTETTEENAESGYEVPGLSIRIGEMKDGVYVRGFMDEYDIICNELEGEKLNNALKLRAEARTMDTLTPELEAAGYILEEEDNLALSPEDVAIMYGEAGENAVTPSPVDEDTKFGFVTFAAATEDVIHEPCFIGIKNIEDGSYQEFDLYEQNGYTTLQQLPVGTYSITEGGITADFTGKYPLKANDYNFEITENCSIIVPVAIGDVEVPGGKTVSTPEPTATPEATVEPTEEPVKENNSSMFVGLFLSIGALLIVGIIALVIMYKRKNK